MCNRVPVPTSSQLVVLSWSLALSTNTSRTSTGRLSAQQTPFDPQLLRYKPPMLCDIVLGSLSKKVCDFPSNWRACLCAQIIGLYSDETASADYRIQVAGLPLGLTDENFREVPPQPMPFGHADGGRFGKTFSDTPSGTSSVAHMFWRQHSVMQSREAPQGALCRSVSLRRGTCLLPALCSCGF